MPRAAVLGQPIAHSMSPILHTAGYKALGLDDWSYTRIEANAETLPGIVSGSEEDYRGFSVTMPGKFAAFSLASEITDRARLMGSANTLVRIEGGWRADNTDTEGVEGALTELLGRADNLRVRDSSTTQQRALLIGSGGTARPALWALAQRGIKNIDLLNRTDRRSELQHLTDSLGQNLTPVNYSDDIEKIAQRAEVIISTVPSPALEGHEETLAHAPILDVIYDPWPTPLTVHAASDGYPTVGGHRMLAYQAFSQFEQFTGQEAPREAMFEALKVHMRDKNVNRLY